MSVAVWDSRDADEITVLLDDAAVVLAIALTTTVLRWLPASISAIPLGSAWPMRSPSPPTSWTRTAVGARGDLMRRAGVARSQQQHRGIIVSVEASSFGAGARVSSTTHAIRTAQGPPPAHGYWGGRSVGEQLAAIGRGVCGRRSRRHSARRIRRGVDGPGVLSSGLCRRLHWRTPTVAGVSCVRTPLLDSRRQPGPATRKSLTPKQRAGLHRAVS